ncbi:hypothetical protein [Oceanirhabdus sp. W0125-5]|nr:hypothetical protein [Oceanirhabdus sp. W0125-5]WBW95913.1 hypothetical protein OW730_19805 [Oceanirhabdus sp. W0125-5]
MPKDPRMETKPSKNEVTKEKFPSHTGKRDNSQPFKEEFKNKNK